MNRLHQDYQLRAADYHKKTDHLKKLNELARERNPDEFYFKMINSKNLQNSVDNKTPITDEERKRILKQNLIYVNFQKQLNLKKIEKNTILPTFSGCHKRFDDQTSGPIEQPTRLSDSSILTPEQLNEIKIERYKQLKLIKSRLDRIEKLDIASCELTVQNQISKKGRKKKVGVDSRGISVYKWKGFRQK